MPFVGLGLHILLALFCAVHVVRTGQQLFWLIILFSFPLLGSIVYFLVIYLPNSRLQRSAHRAVSVAARAMDPTKAVRQARADFDEAPTAQNQMRLAAALLDVGEAGEAVVQYQGCLKGPFGSDPDIRYGLACALVESDRHAEALEHLRELQASRPEFRTEVVQLLLARSLAGTSRPDEARAAYEAAVSRFGSFDAYAEYAIWAFNTGDAAKSAELSEQIEKITGRWNRANRELNASTMRRLQAARQGAR